MSETARPIAASGATGTTCQTAGPYRSARNARDHRVPEEGRQVPRRQRRRQDDMDAGRARDARCSFVPATRRRHWLPPRVRLRSRVRLEVIGTWRLVNTSESQPMLVTFGADGWANVVTVTGAGRPEDFDTIAQVRYQLVPRRDPKRIEFQTRRGNDLFPTGSSSWQITSHTDESFLEPPQRLGRGRSVGVVQGANASLLPDLRCTRHMPRLSSCGRRSTVRRRRTRHSARRSKTRPRASDECRRS